jgi:hypothetical protein
MVIVRVAGSIEYWNNYNEVDDYTLRVDEKTTLNPKNKKILNRLFSVLVTMCKYLIIFSPI